MDLSDPSGYVCGHAYVDLGLSVKWATCNVGATSPEQYGERYAWGETQAKSSYTGYNSKTYVKNGIWNIVGDLEYDAARAMWGGTWRLPTDKEIRELCQQCLVSYDPVRGGYVYVSRENGASVFFPEHGGEPAYDKASVYWSGISTDRTNAASFRSTGAYSWSYRFVGAYIRPVTE